VRIKNTISIKPAGVVKVRTTRSFTSLIQSLRWKLLGIIQSGFSKETASVITALTIGYRSHDGKRVYDYYRRAGLSHLMSISGTHFGLLSLILFFLFRLPFRLLPAVTLQRLTRRYSINEITALLTLPFLILYLLMSGFRVPAVRSFIMITFFMASLLLGTRGAWKGALLLAFSVISVINPDAVFTPSFQLSFVAVFSIGTGLEIAEKYQGFSENPIIRAVIKFITVTFFAITGTLPLSLYYFHYIPPFGFITNLLITPLVCFVILPVVVTTSFLALITGAFPLQGLIETLINSTNSLVKLFSTASPLLIPSFQITPLGVLLIYTGILLLIRRRFVVATAILLFGLTPVFVSLQKAENTLVEITFLDVGQGDAAVIKTSTGKLIGIDTGRTGSEMLRYCLLKGREAPEVIVLSHGGADHAGGLFEIIEKSPPVEIWDNGLINYHGLPASLRLRHLERGDILRDRNVLFSVLHPYRGFYPRYGDEENNNSLVLQYTDSGVSAMFPGDLESDGEESILESGIPIRSKILKVGHHGSYTSSTKRFLSAVSPSYAVISVGKGNPYGHPHRSTLERLKGINLFRTDRDGAVSFRLDKNGKLSIKRFTDWMLIPAKAPSLKEEAKKLRNLYLPW
ncbi:MAG: DNA internalization-related competence protein ComEC/Rec2, partial [Nitrospirae bacterium]